MVLMTRKYFPDHVWTLAVRRRLINILCAIYPKCIGRLLHKLLFAKLIPESGDFRSNGGQKKSNYWAGIVADFTWASGVEQNPGAALVKIVKEIRNDAVELR